MDIFVCILAVGLEVVMYVPCHIETLPFQPIPRAGKPAIQSLDDGQDFVILESEDTLLLVFLTGMALSNLASVKGRL